MSVFDVALLTRFQDSTEIELVAVGAADKLLILDSEGGVVFSITAGTLAAFINSAISSADILDALNAPNGVATLGVDGKVPAAQLPAYVDDVLEYATASAFPATGEAGKIYVALDTNLTYRWGGSSYVEISQSLALGETSSTAYRGDRGKTAYDHSQTSGNPHGTSKADVGLGNVDNTSDANKPVSTAQQTALDLKANKAQPAFTEPTLLNGWSNHSIWFPSAGYMKDEFGFVVLTGLVKDGTSSHVFTLPAGYRPSKYTMFPTVAADAYGTIGIETDGSVYVRNGSYGFVSLDNIRFKAA